MDSGVMITGGAAIALGHEHIHDMYVYQVYVGKGGGAMPKAGGDPCRDMLPGRTGMSGCMYSK